MQQSIFFIRQFLGYCKFRLDSWVPEKLNLTVFVSFSIALVKGWHFSLPFFRHHFYYFQYLSLYIGKQHRPNTRKWIVQRDPRADKARAFIGKGMRRQRARGRGDPEGLRSTWLSLRFCGEGVRCRSFWLRALPRGTSITQDGSYRTQLNAEFQSIAKRDKKDFLSEQCKEIEENNRMRKTRGLVKKIGDYQGNISCKDGHDKGQKW